MNLQKRAAARRAMLRYLEETGGTAGPEDFRAMLQEMLAAFSEVSGLRLVVVRTHALHAIQQPAQELEKARVGRC